MLSLADAAAITASLADIAERSRPVACRECEGHGLTGWPRTVVCIACSGSGVEERDG
jgi:DnaJ-class molecular chaperone